MFKFVEAPTRPYEFENNVHISITFEMDLNLKQIDRQVYNLLDLIGDIHPDLILDLPAFISLVIAIPRRDDDKILAWALIRLLPLKRGVRLHRIRSAAITTFLTPSLRLRVITVE